MLCELDLKLKATGLGSETRVGQTCNLVYLRPKVTGMFRRLSLRLKVAGIGLETQVDLMCNMLTCY